MVKEARRSGVAVVGEIELFARELARLKAERGYAPRVLGITGTNGKTTTTRLTGLLVERCGRKVAVAGNIAPAALDELATHLDAGALPDVWVLELSSFQLETTAQPRLRCRGRAQRDAGSPGLARLDGGVRRRPRQRIFSRRHRARAQP